MIVPFVLYTVVLYTLILHASFNSARRSLLCLFCQPESSSPYFASTSIRRSLFRQFRQREDFLLLFRNVQPIGYTFCSFLSIFAQISLQNLQTIQFCWREAGVIIVLYFNFVAPVLFSNSCTAVLLYPLTAQIQLCSCTDPGPSCPSVFTLTQVVLILFARFELRISHSDLQKTFSVYISFLTLIERFKLCMSQSDLQKKNFFPVQTISVFFCLCAPSFIVAAIFCSSWDECPTNLWILPVFRTIQAWPQTIWSNFVFTMTRNLVFGSDSSRPGSQLRASNHKNSNTPTLSPACQASPLGHFRHLGCLQRFGSSFRSFENSFARAVWKEQVAVLLGIASAPHGHARPQAQHSHG